MTIKQYIRICYVLCILSAFFNLLNIAQVFPSIGYLVKMLSQIVYSATPFLCFFIYLNVTFGFVIHSIGIRFDETLIKDFNGDYAGIDNWYLPYLFYTFRQSLGDFKVDTFLFLPKRIMYITWFVWFFLIIMNSMIFLNFLISVITEVYESVRELQIEESYRRKAETLRYLDLVFGEKIDFLPVNILVTRQNMPNIEREVVDDNLVQMRKKFIRDQRAIQTSIHHLKHDFNSMQQDIFEVKSLLKESL